MNYLKKLSLIIVTAVLISLTIFTNQTFAQEPPSINVWVLRGLIRENAHSQVFFDKIQKKYPQIKFYGLEVKGNGEYFQESSPTSIKQMVTDAREKFLKINEQFPNSKNYLIAISLGGMIGTSWMQTHPNDFAHAIILNSSLKGYCSLTQRLLIKNISKFIKFIFESDPMEKEKILYSMIISDQEKHKYLIDQWTQIRKERPVSLMNTLRQMYAGLTFSPPNIAPIENITIGVGLADDFVSPECSKNIANKWNKPLITHPTGGHDITNDKPEWIIELVDEFFLN